MSIGEYLQLISIDPWHIAASVLNLIILFFIAGIIQNYAEGMYILALSLLMRVLSNIATERKYINIQS